MKTHKRKFKLTSTQVTTQADLRSEKVRILRGLLKTARQALHDASTRSEETIEHVHRLRVSSRRSLAALEIFCPGPTSDSAKWMRKRLKQFLRTAGEARDLDVLQSVQLPRFGIHAERLGTYWAEERRACQKSLIKLDRRMRKDEKFRTVAKSLLREMSRRSLDDVEKCNGKDSAEEWIWRRIAVVAAAVSRAIPATSNPESIHQLRIQGKKFRYTLELLSPLLPPNSLSSMVAQAKDLQERLGRVQDHVVAVKQLEELRFQQREVPDVAIVQSRVREEYDHVLRSVAEFQQWLHSKERRAFQEALDLLGESTGSKPAGES